MKLQEYNPDEEVKGGKKHRTKDDDRYKQDQEKEREEFKKLVKSSYDPYDQVDLDKPDGKIEVGDDGHTQKFKYYIMKHQQEQSDRYFNDFDWKAKGVVRKRFDAIKRQKIVKKGVKLPELKDKLDKVKESVKELELLTGRLDDVRKSIQEQYIRLQFMAQPKEYYKDLFALLNSKTYKEQIDVRMMPAYYVHRKVKEALKSTAKHMGYEKDRKFKTSLSDHTLFAIVCDSKSDTNHHEREEGDNDYDDIPMLIHKLLAKMKYEYVFFTDDTGKREVGAFLVLISALPKKDQS